ncbi:MAG: insulinase family protein [Myxococcales bacterium]|nr:insulinase family protein [Myxococcales bacterium]MCB9643012.1 insulinase family protein [Myxococcales bacterium]
MTLNPLFFFFLLAAPPQGGGLPTAKPSTSRPASKQAPTSQATKKSEPSKKQPTVQKKNTPTKQAVAQKAKPKQPTDWLPKGGLKQDTDVKVSMLPQSTLAWCYANKAPNVLRLRIAIAAGSSNDPRNLRGQSRFLAKLLAYRLNLPENPAQTPLPVGGTRYQVSLHKDWVFVDVFTRSSSLSVILKHIAKKIAEAPFQGLSLKTQKQIRSELARSAFGFPTVSLEERVDAYFYAGYPRGTFLRGQRRTFSSITSQQLQKAHKQLYSGEKIRVLMVGDLSCEKAFTALASAFTAISGKGPLSYPPRNAPENLATSQRGRLFLTQDLLFAYMLPSLQREDALPLDFLLHISREELERAFVQRFGETPRTKHILKAYPQSGYALWLIPMPSVGRPEMRDLLQKAIGGLLMSPYDPPSLVGHLETYKQETTLRWSEKMSSSQGTLSMLWEQMRLPSKVDYAYDWRTMSEALTTPSIRKLARHYLQRSSSLQRSPQAFSLQRVVLFIGSLLMLWFLLDLMIRRARRYDD